MVYKSSLMRKEEAFTQLIKRKRRGSFLRFPELYCDTQENQKDLYQDIVFQLWKGFEQF